MSKIITIDSPSYRLDIDLEKISVIAVNGHDICVIASQDNAFKAFPMNMSKDEFVKKYFSIKD